MPFPPIGLALLTASVALALMAIPVARFIRMRSRINDERINPA
jgi:hypothetical protein